MASSTDGLADREHRRQPGDLEHLEDPGLGAHQRQVAAVAAQALEAADQHAQPGRVEEVHAFEIDDDLAVPLADQLDQPLPQARRAVDVDLALDSQNRERRSAVVYLQTELHRRVLPDRVPTSLSGPKITSMERGRRRLSAGCGWREGAACTRRASARPRRRDTSRVCVIKVAYHAQLSHKCTEGSLDAGIPERAAPIRRSRPGRASGS